MKERWRAISGYEKTHEVSNFGRVRRKAYILQPSKVNGGHLKVSLERGKNHSVHHLVLKAFIGRRPPNLEVRHLNGKPEDNRLINLEYNSRSQNTLDRKWHMTRPRPQQKLSPTVIRKIKRLLPHKTQVELAHQFGVIQTTISKIKTGKLHWDV